MKMTLLPSALLLMLFSSVTVLAASFTVSNNPNISAQFTDLQVAIDQAGAGDTIYISGSNTNYGDAFVGRPITLIGEGYFGGEAYGLTTSVDMVRLAKIDNEGSNCDGSAFYGLYIDEDIRAGGGTPNSITYSFHQAASDIFVSDCYVKSEIDNVNGDNWQIFHSYINTFSPNFTNGYIANCIINQVRDLNDPGTLFTQCIFDGNFSVSTDADNFTIINSIFINPNATISTTTGVTYQNNLFFSTSLPDASVFDNSTPESEDNLLTTNLTTALVDATTIGPATPIYENDYNLAGGSPAAGAGVNGEDLGIYGGLTPWPNNFGGIPPTPQFDLLNIENPVVGPDCEIKVSSGASINN